MTRKEFDPLAYIESGFLDSKSTKPASNVGLDEVEVPSIREFLGGEQQELPFKPVAKKPEPAPKEKRKFRKTEMSAPRPRRAGRKKVDAIDPKLQTVWSSLPKNVDFLMSFFDDSVTANYYRGEFKESREELLKRLLDPELNLEETSRLLGVCPATVRRYTNRGWLHHHRTQGGQRRFRLSSLVKFVEEHGRFPEE